MPPPSLTRSQQADVASPGCCLSLLFVFFSIFLLFVAISDRLVAAQARLDPRTIANEPARAKFGGWNPGACMRVPLGGTKRGLSRVLLVRCPSLSTQSPSGRISSGPVMSTRGDPTRPSSPPGQTGRQDFRQDCTRKVGVSSFPSSPPPMASRLGPVSRASRHASTSQPGTRRAQGSELV